MTTETPAADIVERLRETRKRGVFDAIAQGVYASADEAADEIARLRAENAELSRTNEVLASQYCAASRGNAELQRKLDEAVSGLSVVNGLIADGPNPSVLDAVAKISLTVSKTLSSIRGEA